MRDDRHHAAAGRAGADALRAHRPGAARAARTRRRAAPRELVAGRDGPFEPGTEFGEEARVDRVRERVLAVEDVCAGALQQLLRLPAPLDADHRVVGPVADRDRREGWLEVVFE